MKLDNPKIFIDATVFMGMHACDLDIRNKSTALMSKLFFNQVFMNYEQVGICDDFVWTFSRDIQDHYYPFMDCLHSQMDIKRMPYLMDDVRLAIESNDIANSDLSSMQSLLIAQVLRYQGVLYTHDPKIKNLRWFANHLGDYSSIDAQDSTKEPLFTDELDLLYQQSACLRVEHVTLY
jgi:hypothetical protein